jgi:hypothetical protein
VLADAYLGMGASRVLFDYVFLRPSHIAYFRNALGENVSAHLFTLWAPLEVVEARERMRGGRAPLGVAVADCYREIEANRQVLGHFLQTGDALPEVVAGEIHRLVASGRIQETEEGACRNVPGRSRLIHCRKDKFC